MAGQLCRKQQFRDYVFMRGRECLRGGSLKEGEGRENLRGGSRKPGFDAKVKNHQRYKEHRDDEQC